MTGSASHSEECNKAQCAARRRARRQAYRRRCDIWIACISAVLSVALILLVVLLMSFIEFQSRLANSRSDIRASELVNRLLESYENPGCAGDLSRARRRVRRQAPRKPMPSSPSADIA